MDGAKTVLAMLISTIAAPWLVAHGFPALGPDETAQATAAVVGVVGVAMRTISSGPIFGAARAWFATRRQPTPAEIAQQMTDAALAEIANRKPVKGEVKS